MRRAGNGLTKVSKLMAASRIEARSIELLRLAFSGMAGSGAERTVGFWAGKVGKLTVSTLPSDVSFRRKADIGLPRTSHALEVYNPLLAPPKTCVQGDLLIATGYHLRIGSIAIGSCLTPIGGDHYLFWQAAQTAIGILGLEPIEGKIQVSGPVSLRYSIEISLIYNLLTHAMCLPLVNRLAGG